MRTIVGTLSRVALLLATVLATAMFLATPAKLLAAGGFRTPNFVVSAPTPQLCQEIGAAAEQYRKDLAIEWLGHELPNWRQPCPINAQVAQHLGAGGATSFVFDRGEVFGWEMNIQGSRERVLDSVLPHEITHTVFASHFRRPVPRWADEGACTTVEHTSEVSKQERLLIQFLKSQKGIAFSHMFAMKEYPRDVLPLYSQGHSLTQYLLERRGKKAFLAFLEDGMQDENWPRAVQAHYGQQSLLALQNDWLGWVKQGRPRLPLDADIATVAAAPARPASGGVQLASATSVYAARKSEPSPQASVYDASRETGSVWR